MLSTSTYTSFFGAGLPASLLFLTLSAVAQPSYKPAAARTLLRAGHVLDVHTGRELAAETIIIQGERITALAPTAETPAQPGDRVVDLTAYTLLPGLIDVHVHLTGVTNFDPYFELSMTPAKEAILGVENAKTTLDAGFTTVRNVGANGFTDVRAARRNQCRSHPGAAHAGQRTGARDHRRPHG